MGVAGALAKWFFRAAAPSWVTQGFRPMQAVRRATELGWEIRYQDKLNIYREYTKLFKRETLLKAWPRDRLPHRGLMMEKDLKQPRKYQIVGDIEYFDYETQKPWTVTGSVYDDELRLLDDYENELVDTQFKNPSEPQMAVIHFTPRQIFHNRTMPY